MKTINKKSELFSYRLIRSKRRTLEIGINSEAKLVVRAPMRMSVGEIERFLREKEEWVVSKLELMQNKKKQVEAKKYINGEVFFYLGKKYKLIITNNKKIFEFNDGFLLKEGYEKYAKRRFFAWYKKEAKRIITLRANYYSRIMDFQYTGISINSASKRWGSCTYKNKLNFTWRLIMAPLEIIDYVIVHELAHVKEKNHSSKFWKVVENVVPDYKVKRKWLRDNGHLFVL